MRTSDFPGGREPAGATFTPVVNDTVLCSLDYGKAHVGDGGVIFLDVRSDGEWTGDNSRGGTSASGTCRGRSTWSGRTS